MEIKSVVKKTSVYHIIDSDSRRYKRNENGQWEESLFDWELISDNNLHNSLENAFQEFMATQLPKPLFSQDRIEALREIEFQPSEPPNLQQKALIVIERLSYLSTGGDVHNAIYRFSHVALGRCSSYDHSEWEEQLQNQYQHLIDTGQIQLDPRKGK